MEGEEKGCAKMWGGGAAAYRKALLLILAEREPQLEHDAVANGTRWRRLWRGHCFVCSRGTVVDNGRGRARAGAAEDGRLSLFQRVPLAVMAALSCCKIRAMTSAGNVRTAATE